MSFFFVATSFNSGSTPNLVAKLKAIAFGLVEAINIGVANAVVESDCKAAIDLILGVELCLNEFGSILQDIHELSTTVDVIFCFSPRACNSVAHGLARYAFRSCYVER